MGPEDLLSCMGPLRMEEQDQGIQNWGLPGGVGIWKLGSVACFHCFIINGVDFVMFMNSSSTQCTCA